MLLHNFLFLQFFNEHWIYWCSFWSCYSLPCQLFLLLHKNLNYKCFISIYIMNYCLSKLHLFVIQFSFYTFQRWWWLQWQFQWKPHNQQLNIQHTFSLCSSTSVLFNNSASSSYLRLCSLLCTSFSFDILCSFSITLSALILLWTPKFWKCTQLPTTNTICF